ncbi:MAG: FAD-dependent oxidoreductase [Opitutaceae bacterium]|jgi:hypothetical protein|nr:FAD-dependent oxidoreductase [Opitutaceae bacterium]
MKTKNQNPTTRRDFLKETAAAGLLLAAVPASLRGQPAAGNPPRQAAVSAPLGKVTGMRTHLNSTPITKRSLSADFVVVGGGLSGVCAALAAARHGSKVIIIQDRPMLGGNASSEIRMGVLGSHGNNNKETGIFEELQLENIYKNPLMRFTLWDDILYSAATRENITLLLNTSVQAVRTENNIIKSVTAWNINEYCEYTVGGRVFADCSGDSILRLSGAEFRMGREAAAEFDEDFRQSKDADTHIMGSSILMQLRKCDVHRPFIAPDWACHFTDETIPKNKNPYPKNNNFWWIEYGGKLDTIADAGQIQFELKRIAYGVWEYMKNHKDGRCADYELDWFGSLPGKRESCRLVGDLIVNQHDLMKGGVFPDVVCHGGWTLDDHHPEGFYFDGYQSDHHYPKTPFGLPYRMFYSKNINNLLFAGRNVSCTHIGLSATRVMATCAVMGQAVGTAAALTKTRDCLPRDIYKKHITELQDILQDDDQLIPNRPRKIPAVTLAATAQFEELRKGLDRHEENGKWVPDPTAKSGSHGDGHRWKSKPVLHGVVLKAGESAEYKWAAPVSLSKTRVVFDTNLNTRNKRMRKLEATTEYESLPKMLAREFAIEALVDGKWTEIIHEKDNWKRLYRKTFPSIKCAAIRLKVLSTWGGETPARVFGFEAA